MKVLSNLDLNLNQLLNPKLQIIASDPASPSEGQFWYNSTTKRFKWRNDLTTYDITDALTLGGQTLAQVRDFSLTTGTRTNTAISDFDTQVRLSRLDQMAAPTLSVALNNQKITGLAAPTLDGDAATKAYADSVASGLDVKGSVRATTTVNGALATAFANASIIDGVTLATGDRILLKNQTAGAENGIYTVNATGAPTRATDADSNTEVTAGMFTFVEEGTTLADTGWVMSTNGAIVLGTTALAFTQFTGAGTITASNVNTAGQGVFKQKTGNDLEFRGVAAQSTKVAVTLDAATNEIRVDVAEANLTHDNIGGTLAVTKGGTGGTTAATARTNLGAVGKYSALIGTGAVTTVTVTQATHLLASSRQLIVETLEEASGNHVICDVSVAANGDVTFTFAVAPATNAIRVVIIG